MNAVGDLAERLNDTKKLRVWSVIITFFGDAIVPRGGSVSARTVQILLDRMGIEAGAVRTAFSRLTNDGWVVREKLGRSSFYHLSPMGLGPFAAATDRIYAPLPTANPANPANENWRLTLRENDFPKPHLRKLESDRDTKPISKPSDDFLLDGTFANIPDWLKNMSCQPAHRQSYSALMEAFEPIAGADLSDIDSLAVRCLLIHEWRRILFQFDKVEPEFWTTDWPEPACHRFVCDLYQQLLPSSEAWMDAEATGPLGRIPQPESALVRRFS